MLFTILLITCAIAFPFAFAEELSEKDNKFPNMESSLSDLYWNSIGTPEYDTFPNEYDNEMVRVVLEMKSIDSPIPDNLGIIVELTFEHMIQAMVPVRNLGAIASHENVNIVRLPFLPTLDTITSSGVYTINSHQLNDIGYTGDEITVAVIDTGFDMNNPEISENIIGYATIGNLGDFHGTAVSELIVDVAPDVNLYIENEHLSFLGFLHSVDKLIELGTIDIITMALSWDNVLSPDNVEIMSERVDATRDNGILWVNSAGNYAERHWQGNFTDYDGDNWNNFSFSDETIDIDVNAGDTLDVTLTWWGSRYMNFELCLYDDGIRIQCSDNHQPVFEPYENINYTFPYDTTAEIRIFKHRASTDVNFQLFSSHKLNEYSIPASSIGTPGNMPSSFTVGAIHSKTNVLERYSSQGPTLDGRVKPDIVAPACVQTSILFTFCGTSASAPYVAGSAALLMQKYPDATVNQIQALLEATTHNRHEKSNLDGTGTLDLSMFTGDILAVYNSDGNCTSEYTPCFFPDVFQINPGQTVTWINADNQNIRITGDGMDSGLMSRGQTYAKTFYQSGTYTYVDSEHPWAYGTIIVNADPVTPEITSLKISGPNQAMLLLDRPVTFSISDFGKIEITGEQFSRNVIAVDNLSSTVFLTFDGSPVRTDATGIFYDVLGRDIHATDGQLPVLENLSLSGTKKLATIGDVLLLEFEASEMITNISANINGNPARITNIEDNKWTASKIIDDSDIGPVEFLITFVDNSGNVNSANSTTDGSSISISEPNRLVTGVVFHDLNNNGIQDEGEDGIQTMVSIFTWPLLRVSTDTSGVYSFTDPPSGSQTIFVDVPAGFEAPLGIFHRDVLIKNESIINFALISEISATGTVTASVTSDGIPINSALVRLESLPPQTGLTDDTGTITFENVSPGEYVILATSFNHDISHNSLTVVAGSDTDVAINLKP